MRLVACDPLVGLLRVKPERYVPDCDDLLAEMARLGVDEAIVRHRAAYEAGVAAGNHAIAEDLVGRQALRPAWVVTPDGVEPDYSPALLVERMLAAGSLVCWMDPAAEGFSALPWCSGPLYELLQARRVPLLVEYAKISADHLDVVLGDFPELRLILLGVPRLGRHRLLYPLLTRHPNLYVCLSYTYSVHLGIEDLCQRFGPHRWVFGMGYPEAEGGASVAGLSYAAISDQARRAIAHGNIERLLAEVDA